MKKIVIVLIIIILASLGLIGYLIFSQSQSNFGGLTRILSGTPQTPVTPTNPFPIANPTQTSTETNTNNQTGTSTNTNINSNNSGLTNKERPILEQLSIAGLTTLIVNKKQVTFFIDRESGNLYSLSDQNNLVRQSFTTLPRVGEAYLSTSNDVLRVILRQAKSLEVLNQIGQIKLGGTEPVELTYKSLGFSPVATALSPNGQKVAYLNSDDSNNGSLYTSDWSFSKPKKVWSANFSSFNLAWPRDNLISITAKPAYDYPGFNYLFNTETGKATKTLSNINGLTVSLSPSGLKLIYSKSLLSSFNLYTYDVKTGESRLVDFNTLPEKCVWADSEVLYCAIPKAIPTGNYPDDWYKGKISFADNIWKIDLKQKTTLLVNQIKGSYDLINLSVNKQTGWLYAIDKNTNTLQAFSL